jgi:hypothetical protein
MLLSIRTNEPPAVHRTDVEPKWGGKENAPLVNTDEHLTRETKNKERVNEAGCPARCCALE